MQSDGWCQNEVTNNRFDTSMARRFGLTRPIVAWGPRDCTGCKHNTGLPGRDKYGDHDEGTCSKNQGHRTSAHDAVRDLLIAFLRQCHFQDIRWEVKNWDHTAGPNVKEGQRRVPDIICTDPYNNTVYIIDVRIAWNLSTSGGGDGEYYTGKLAKEAEDCKWAEGAGWGHCLKHHQDFKAGAKFVPFGVEISGELGPAAQQFFGGA